MSVRLSVGLSEHSAPGELSTPGLGLIASGYCWLLANCCWSFPRDIQTEIKSPVRFIIMVLIGYILFKPEGFIYA